MDTRAGVLYAYEHVAEWKTRPQVCRILANVTNDAKSRAIGVFNADVQVRVLSCLSFYEECAQMRGLRCAGREYEPEDHYV